jgi:type II secretory pathway pseudopilin PulG
VRGFSLIESLVLAAVLAALVAIAAPSLAPVLWQAQLRQAGEELAAVVHEARREALTSGRCVRLRTGGERQVVVERLNSYDCLGNPQRAARAGDGPLWEVLPSRSLRLPPPVKVRLEVGRTPALTRRGAPPPATGQAELRLLPDGTLLTEEPGAWGFELQHARLATEQRLHVVLEVAGVECVVAGRLPPDEGCP